MALHGEDARTFIEAPQVHRLPSFLVTVPDPHGARIIGGCGLSPHDDEVNLGYWITPAEQGRGYATEAARSLLGLARVLGHQRIVAHHYIDNLPRAECSRRSASAVPGESSNGSAKAAATQVPRASMKSSSRRRQTATGTMP
ncbi:GNAT family N-acetyltransferase [Novosphingobium panipatense]